MGNMIVTVIVLVAAGVWYFKMGGKQFIDNLLSGVTSQVNSGSNEQSVSGGGNARFHILNSNGLPDSNGINDFINQLTGGQSNQNISRQYTDGKGNQVSIQRNSYGQTNVQSNFGGVSYW